MTLADILHWIMHTNIFVVLGAGLGVVFLIMCVIIAIDEGF